MEREPKKENKASTPTRPTKREFILQREGVVETNKPKKFNQDIPQKNERRVWR